MARAAGATMGNRGGGPLERRVRLATGLVLFLYALSHFANHAVGLLSPTAMQGANAVLHDPWTTVPGQALLYGSFGVHAALGLLGIYRRLQLRRLPWGETFQLGLGLLIPLLLIRHAVYVRLGQLLYDLSDSYQAVLYGFWLVAPENLLRQFVLLLAVWVHGCIGVHAVLRLRPSFPAWRSWLTAAAMILPLLSMAGALAGSMDLERLVAQDPVLADRLRPPAPGSEAALARAALGVVSDRLVLGWILLVGAAFAVRGGRALYERRFKAVRITYPGGRVVAVARGFSVLEASRWAGLPHASVCGGRGRCSTCRVRVLRGEADLPEPEAVEQATLARIGAPAHVRLACQLRLTSDATIAPLVAPGAALEGSGNRPPGALEAGQERVVAAWFADLRDSTRMTAGQLPFDALFLIDCWIQAVSGVVHRHGGRVTCVAGDGVMAVFGVDTQPEAACRSALAAARDLGGVVADLSRELGASLSVPMRFSVGMHVGPAIVGYTTLAREDGGRSLQFFGDPGNVAARLESLTKERNCAILASRAVLEWAGVEVEASSCFEVTVRGRDEIAPLCVCVVADVAGTAARTLEKAGTQPPAELERSR